MKRNCRRLMIALVLIASFNVTPMLCSAQGDDPTDPDAPIDGGVSILIAAGVGYGLKKARDQRKKNKNNTVGLEKQSSL